MTTSSIGPLADKHKRPCVGIGRIHFPRMSELRTGVGGLVSVGQGMKLLNLDANDSSLLLSIEKITRHSAFQKRLKSKLFVAESVRLFLQITVDTSLEETG